MVFRIAYSSSDINVIIENLAILKEEELLGIQTMTCSCEIKIRVWLG